MIFASRRTGAPDPFLRWKIQLFSIGAVMALVGIAFESSLLVGLAILVLVGGAALRFFSGTGSVQGEAGSGGDDSDEDEDPA